MAGTNGVQSTDLEEVRRAHVLKVVADHPDLAKWRVAALLGIHPNTLAKLLKRWSGNGEELVRDQR